MRVRERHAFACVRARVLSFSLQHKNYDVMKKDFLFVQCIVKKNQCNCRYNHYFTLTRQCDCRLTIQCDCRLTRLCDCIAFRKNRTTLLCWFEAFL